MSELVERHMESMIEEIEEMRRTNLYTVEETRMFLKKRKSFEYKVNGITKQLHDFIDYIDFEKSILRDLKIRREKLRIVDKKSNIEFRILKRIKHLYEIGIERFKSDFSLCLAYFKFCRESSYIQSASLVIQHMLKTFSFMPEAWLVAVAWHKTKNIDQALNTIHKGLILHATCQELYSEAIRLEYLAREKRASNNSKEQTTNDELFCKKIELYLETIFKNITDFKFICDVLKQLEPLNCTAYLQQKIVDWLLENYSDEELVWHTLAQRERDGRSNIPKIENNPIPSKKFCILKCIEKYQEGLSKISNSKKPALWNLYLDFLIELETGEFQSLAEQKLQTTFEEALKEIQLNENYFIHWAKITNDALTAISIIEKGLQTNPDSVELWKVRLKYCVILDDTRQFNQVFKRSICQLKENAHPMWLMAISFHSLSNNFDILNQIYQEAVKQPKPISDVTKPEYIQWLVLSKDIEYARQAYNLLAREKPYCRELHTAMAKIESLELDIDILKLENVLNLACEQFGHEDIGVRLDLIKFYLKHRESFEEKMPSFDLNDKILKIYNEAESVLKSKSLLLAHFKEQYELIKQSTEL